MKICTPIGDERIRAESALHLALAHRGESRIKWFALGTALVLHVTALLVSFPHIQRAVAPAPKRPVVVVRRYIPPPPVRERRVIPQQQKLTRKIPVPDPTPDEPEPIREPDPEDPPPLYPDDAEIVLGVPTPPGPSGPGEAEPLLAGVGGCTNPVRIEDSYVQPEYPELARAARLEGNVILRAVICRDGTVQECEVLRCTQPGLGFEESAIAAAKQWRYEPATQNGIPVDVYFTVFVDFSLRTGRSG